MMAMFEGINDYSSITFHAGNDWAIKFESSGSMLVNPDLKIEPKKMAEEFICVLESVWNGRCEEVRQLRQRIKELESVASCQGNDREKTTTIIGDK